MASGYASRLAYTCRPCGLDRSHYPIVIACIFIPVPIRRVGSHWPSNHDFDIDCIILQLDIWRDRGSGLLGKSLVRLILPPSFNFLFLFFLRLCIYMLRRPGGRANGSFTLFHLGHFHCSTSLFTASLHLSLVSSLQIIHSLYKVGDTVGGDLHRGSC